MTLATIKAVVCNFFEKQLVDTTNLGVDLFLVAANNVRKRAEMLHNFESSWCKGTAVVVPTDGVALSAVTIAPTNTYSGVKEIISVAQSQSGSYVPITLRRPNQGPARYIPRIPTDGQVASSFDSSYLILRGDRLYLFPDPATGSSVTVYLEMYGWLNEYVTGSLATADLDFFVTHGYEYLQWGIILELNYLWQKFVFRQEGNPGAPERKLQDAWEALVQWDSYRASHSIRDDR